MDWHCNAPHGSSISSSRKRLAEEKSEVASLERQLSAMRSRLSNVPLSRGDPCREVAELRIKQTELEEELERACAHDDHLVKFHKACISDADSARASSALLHSEIRDAHACEAAVADRCLCIQTESAAAATRGVCLQQELEKANAASENLLAKQIALQERAASEWTEARSLRQELAQTGWGLALLRSTAKNHVEGLRGSVNSLDQYVRVTCEGEAFAAGPGPVHSDSQVSGSQTRRLKSSRGGSQASWQR